MPPFPVISPLTNHLISMTPNRTNILLISIISLFAANLTRFFYWQIIRGHEFHQKQLSQNYKITKIEPIPGEIISQDQYPLVINQNRYQLSIYKPDLKTSLSDITIAINHVRPDLTQELTQLISDFQQNPQQKWLTLPQDFSRDQTIQLQLPGLSFKKVNRRFYPEETMLLPILGNSSTTGLQSYYQQQLIGRTGFTWTPKDAVGEPILSDKSWQIEPVNGRDLHLNINRSIQYVVENQLAQGIRQYQADSGSVIVLESSTGKVLAISSQEASPSGNSKIIAIADLFEPGSIFKPLVVAMALDSQTINQDYVCQNCNQPKTVGDHTINNWDFSLHPNSNLYDIIKNSDNIGMSSIIEILGLKQFTNYYYHLGLNQKTGIDLPGEAKPPQKTYWSPIDLATASFGQGFAINQIQMITAFNTLANNGFLVPPRIAEYLSQNNQSIPIKSSPSRQIFSVTTTNLIKSILKYSVNNGAVARYKPAGLEVCAKSGTAQVAVSGGYSQSLANASYLGFFPCDQPKITMIVTLFNPKVSSWGSSTAAPVWFNIANTITKLI